MPLKLKNNPLKPVDWKAEIQLVLDQKWCDIPEVEPSAKLGAMTRLCEEFGRELNALRTKYNALREETDT